jgi:hypothetical protein
MKIQSDTLTIVIILGIALLIIAVKIYVAFHFLIKYW